MSSVKEPPIHRYLEIRTHLLELIENGELTPGDRIPSERELTERFAVSRMTVRQALTELENLGYVYRVQGKGSFVSTPKMEQPLNGLTSFTEDMRQRSLVPGTVILSSEVLLPGHRVASALGLTQSDPVFRLQRLRLANGEPMALEIVHIPTKLVPDLLEGTSLEQSLYQILKERYGIRLHRALQSLEAVPAAPLEATMLRIREGTPVLQIERISRDPDDNPVEYVRSLYRGDRYRFTAHLIRGEE